jgi:DNA-binding NarL/FixJ family response regulator
VCQGLHRIVEHECDLTVCGEASTARAARALTKELEPDVAVVDVGLERGDGIDLVRDLRAHHPRRTWSVKLGVCNHTHHERFH